MTEEEWKMWMDIAQQLIRIADQTERIANTLDEWNKEGRLEIKVR